MSDNIPLDIWREILVRLPAESLIRSRAVCKGWQAIIDDPCFVRAHTNLSSNNNNNIINIIYDSIDPPFTFPLCSFDLEALNPSNGLQTIAVTPIDFTSGLPFLPLAMCNGLILTHEMGMGIWNPSTGERLELPLGKFKYAAIGLGYDCTTDDYKVVAISRRVRHHRRYVHRTHVYSLKSDSWKRIMNCPSGTSNDDYLGGPVGPGVFVCGALNWLTTLAQEGGRSSDETIIALDLRTEKYRLLQMPQATRRMRRRDMFLDVWGTGCLILTDFPSASCTNSHLDVWAMKDYGDEDESWTKLFSIEKQHRWMGSYLKPVAFMKKEEEDKMQQVFLQDGCRRFFLFDVDTNSIKRVTIHGLHGFLCAYMFPATLFRLNDNCGFSGTRRRKRSTKITLTSKTKNASSAVSKLIFCIKDSKYLDDFDPRDNHLSSPGPHWDLFSLSADESCSRYKLKCSNRSNPSTEAEDCYLFRDPSTLNGMGIF